jgi:hypothetical protein
MFMPTGRSAAQIYRTPTAQEGHNPIHRRQAFDPMNPDIKKRHAGTAFAPI